jgi:hypothetical protein
MRKEQNNRSLHFNCFEFTYTCISDIANKEEITLGLHPSALERGIKEK